MIKAWTFLSLEQICFQIIRFIPEKGYNRDQLSATAKNANARKCDIYDRLRSGTLLIPKCLNETSTYASRDETSQLFLFLRTAFQCDT